MFVINNLTRGESYYIPYFPSSDFYDLYPQRVADIAQLSSTLEAGILTKAKFIQGQGFEDESLNGLKIDKEGTTLVKLLSQLSEAFVRFGGFSMHLGLNGLLRHNTIKYAPFEIARLAQPKNDSDKIDSIFLKYYYKQRFGENNRYTEKKYTAEYPRFTTDQKKIKAQIGQYGNGDLRHFPGQIYWFGTPRSGNYYYPYPCYNSVLQDAITEANLKLSKKYDIEDRFKGQLVIFKPTASAGVTQEQREQDKRDYSQFVAPDGSRVHIEYIPNIESKPDYVQLQPYELSKNYQYAEESVQKNIRQSFGIPDILYGFPTKGKLGTTNEIKEAIQFTYTFVVDAEQRIIENALKEILANFHIKVNFSGLKIKDLTFNELTINQ